MHRTEAWKYEARPKYLYIGDPILDIVWSPENNDNLVILLIISYKTHSPRETMLKNLNILIGWICPGQRSKICPWPNIGKLAISSKT